MSPSDAVAGSEANVANPIGVKNFFDILILCL
jgi:hypothetical protein